jgi:hypothetical protein
MAIQSIALRSKHCSAHYYPYHAYAHLRGIDVHTYTFTTGVFTTLHTLGSTSREIRSKPIASYLGMMFDSRIGLSHPS